MNIGDVPLEEKHDGKYYDPSKKEEYIKRAHKMSENKKSKECGKCHEILPIEEFNKNKNAKDGYKIYCRDCSNEMSRIYYARRKLKTLGPEPEESIYEWVRNLPSDKRELLDTDKVAEIIKKELFCTQGEDE